MTAYADGSLWYYQPSKAACVAFSILFFLSSLVHGVQLLYYKAYRLCLFFFWGALVITGGYVCRAAGAWNDSDSDLYIASQVLLITGPPAFAAGLYIVLGRTMYYVPYLSPIHPGRVFTTFIALDIICEIILANGTARLANPDITPEQIKTGKDIARAGMILQVIMFFFFLLLAAVFHVRCELRHLASRIRPVLIVLHCTGVLLLERSVFRVIEFEGTIYTSQPLFWVFEASAVSLATLLLHVWHPARFLPGATNIYLDTDGKTEKVGREWIDRRVWWASTLDPFNLVGMAVRWKRGERRDSNFWELDPQAQGQGAKQRKAEDVSGNAV